MARYVWMHFSALWPLSNKPDFWLLSNKSFFGLSLTTPFCGLSLTMSLARLLFQNRREVAVVTGIHNRTWAFGPLKTRLPDDSSIFSAEAVALIDALKIIQESRRKKFIIFTDSLSCMQAIENEDISNTLIQKFLIKHTQLLKKRKQITLCWIPSHIGIVGNERADKEAKSSLELDVRPLSIPFTDFLPKAKKFYHNLWRAIWDRSTDFLTLIHVKDFTWTAFPRLALLKYVG